MQGWISASSDTMITSLSSLIQSGKVSLRLADAGGSRGTSESLHVALTQAALNEEPEGTPHNNLITIRQIAWHLQQYAILYLENGASGHSGAPAWCHHILLGRLYLRSILDQPVMQMVVTHLIAPTGGVAMHS